MLKNKKWQWTMSMLITILLFAMIIVLPEHTAIGGGDEGDPKEPTPTPCCPANSTNYAEYLEVREDPKSGEDVEKPYGEMEDVFVKYDNEVVNDENLCFAVTSSFSEDFSASGGADTDICVDNDFGLVVKENDDITTRYLWSGGVPSSDTGEAYTFTPPVPAEGAMVTYTLKVESDDYGNCNVNDDNEDAKAYLYCYFPYKKGDAPEGEISNKPVPTWSSSPTFRWDDQLICNAAEEYELFNSEGIQDMDDVESNPCDYNPPSAAWDDGEANDIPGYYDIKWSDTTGILGYGSSAYLEKPIGGTSSPVSWAVSLKIDDTNAPEMANDPETTVDTVTFNVFYDDLARDMSNQGKLVGPPKMNPTNCFGAANHAFNGSISPIVVASSTGTEVFRRSPDPVTGYYLVGVSVITKNTIPSTTINRGDWFVYNGGGHINTSYSGTSVWEYNGRMNPSQWGTSTVGSYVAEHHIVNGNDVYGVEYIEHHPK